MKTFSVAIVLVMLGCFALPGVARADEALRRIQQSLHDQGFYYGPIDGTPGDETTHAIKRYQIRNGLAVTGELNDETTRSIQRTGTALAKGGSSGGGKITGDAPKSGSDSSADDDRRYAQGNPPAPSNRATPVPRHDADDSEDDAPQPPPPNRPDLRVPPISNGNAPVMPRNGIAPSAELTSVFQNTPYEFAPPPVQSDILRRAQAMLLRDGFYDGEANGHPNPVTFEALTNFQGYNHLRRTGRLDAPTLAVMRLLPGRQQGGFPRGGPQPYYEGRVVQ